MFASPFCQFDAVLYAPLPGAQEEGEAVAAIFDEFGQQPGRRVEVVRLFGPGQATRVTVLDQLINQRFDLMHYAGHCFFNKENPPLSGWIFTGQKVLSANELDRIDRIPRVVRLDRLHLGVVEPAVVAELAILVGEQGAEGEFDGHVHEASPKG